ncbi:MAG: ribosomal protein S18-alanine N-acetyltransferase [bacterium]|nr:ribosomal protein S18-alanine N-acetyltransferase [bacterium]
MGTGTGIRTRKAAAGDIGAITEIEAQQFPHPWKERYFIDELSHDISYFYVAEDSAASCVAGYIIFWIVEEMLELHKIAVAAQYQKKGIGKQLFNLILETAKQKKVTEIFLEVRASNQGAIRLYESFEFKQVGVRKDYYDQPREDAVVYKLEIRNAKSRRDQIRNKSEI